MSRRDLPEWRHDKPPSASKLNRLTGEVGRLTGLPTSGESYVDNTSGRYPIPRRRSGRLSHYRITAKNCIVDGASLYKGSEGEVFPAAHNGGAFGLENNYVIAKPCSPRGLFLTEEDPYQEGYAPDTVLVCLPASFRGFVARNTIIQAQPFAVPTQIEVGISRAVLAVTGGITSLVGTGVDTVSSGTSNNVILFADRPPFFDGVDVQVQVSFFNKFNDPIPDGSAMAVVWELQPDPNDNPSTPVQSWLRPSDYGCPEPEEEYP